MPDASKTINTAPELEGSDDSDDEDYNPETAARSKALAGADDADDSGADSETEETKLGDYDSGDEKVVTKEVGEQDDAAIKTRSQRAQESATAASARRRQAAPTTEASKIDALWAAMNDPSSTEQKMTEARPTEVETIDITRTYEFAGQIHTEKKTVPKESQEARDFLDAKELPVKKAPMRRGMKRRSILDEEAGLGKVKKINTLEKSRMEWSGFVDKEGINDELKRANKNGYLDKQDFLNKTHTLQHDRSLGKKY